ncbi:methylmalonyl-CoA epimerase, mitochondrial isoform X4 [Taeniopygia guttata]|uniref:methylmalonyl-CoA epimerase, mitochondrial isoform X4 n=1 Tax=Taeniopygia guttata TaxID=59729 RepID=UPI003BB912C1
MAAPAPRSSNTAGSAANARRCSKFPFTTKHGKQLRSTGAATRGLLSRLQPSAPTVRTLSSSKSFSRNIPSCLWKLGRLNHVAIAVPDLEKAQSLYKDVLGAQVSETVALPEHGVYTVFVELGNTKLELLHPLGEKSPIASFLQKNKTGGMHHICIEETL